jgi:hypothetical protein
MGAYQLVQSHGRMWASLLKIALPRDASYLILALYFLPAYGLLAAASAYFAAQLIGMFSTFLLISKTQLR